jgi:uncharacterized protein (DUF3084 family)
MSKLTINIHILFFSLFPEKDELLLRNAELSQKNQSVQSTSDAIINQLKSEVKDREDQIEAIQQSHDSLQQNIDLHEKTVMHMIESLLEHWDFKSNCVKIQ